MSDFTPQLLSYLAYTHRPVEPGPCRVCGSPLTIASMGGGQGTKYVCEAISYKFDDESSAHRRQSEVNVSYHGDKRISDLVAHTVELREATGEDMTVSEGDVVYPHGHEGGSCSMYFEFTNGDWQQKWDWEYVHDPSHKN